ncbi:MAG: hypothetical protein BWY78_00079 [Alphaproteobacteria bacterium ADurb.Bin438]|nr:MAG: hypothetical protein BWY78_00079 [Alphaproteobacteria bacterium ADurb.Bin438]
MTRYIVKLRKGEGEQVNPSPIVINEKGEIAEKSVWRGIFDRIIGFTTTEQGIMLFKPVTGLKDDKDIVGHGILTGFQEFHSSLGLIVESVEEISE